MKIDNNSIQLVITYLEQGDESALNTFLNLSLFLDEDRNNDFSGLIASIKALPVKDVKTIRTLLNPKKKKENNVEYVEYVDNGEGYGPNEQDDPEIDPIDEILDKIQKSKSLDNTEKNILSSFYDYNLLDNFSKSLSKKIYFHILRTAQLKFYYFG